MIILRSKLVAEEMAVLRSKYDCTNNVYFILEHNVFYNPLSPESWSHYVYPHF